MSALNMWTTEAGIESIIMHASSFLCNKNPELRTKLLRWLLGHKEAFKDNDMRPYIQGTLDCMQDSSESVQQMGESLFAELCTCLGFDSFESAFKDLEPEVQNSLNPIVNKYRQQKPVGILRPKYPAINYRLDKCENLGSKGKNKPVKQLEAANELISIDNKAKRLATEKYKWSVDFIYHNYLKTLKEPMKVCLTPDLCTLLFHVDFKKQVEGLISLTSIIKSQLREIIEILDILFKFIWIRFQEKSKTQVIKNILEMLDLLINELNDIGYRLNDGEASLLLPIICEKSGQDNAQFRDTIRRIIHNTARVYPATKVFALVLIACNSKNTKSKVECLDELAELVKEYGVEICNPKDIKAIVKYAGSTDKIVRNEAVQLILEIYKLKGDQIWTMVGDMPDNVKDLLEQRFKAISKEVQPLQTDSRTIDAQIN